MIFWIEAAILCLFFTGMVVPSALKRPLNWVSDYPPAIQKRVAELGLLPERQKGTPPAFFARKFIAALLAAVLLALVLIFLNGAESFREGFLLSYGLWLVVDWYDALVLDCLWFCHSRRVVIPGTEDMTEAYHDYGFHVKMSMIGMVLGLPVCLLSGLIVQWLVPLL